MNRTTLQELWYIFRRNVVLPVNGIILVVAVLLSVFGDTRAGVFLSIVLFINISSGLFQDVRAWYALRQLQLLTAPRVTRLNTDGSETVIFMEKIQKNDLIKLRIGDQVPSDGTLIEAENIEINQGLITGESDSIPKATGDQIPQGSVITSGTGKIRIDTVFHESRIARMTEGVKRFSISSSPIQKGVSRIITYCTLALFAGLAIVLVRGYLNHEPALRIVNVAGAVTSMFVPQGLVFTITIFFAFGAAHLFKRKVLLQEVNATEKLGRIKNLCMDKTGTLTENKLKVEKILYYNDPDTSKKLLATYTSGVNDTTEVMLAVKEELEGEGRGQVFETISFSSWRQYAAAHLKADSKEGVLYAGLASAFSPHLTRGEERQWLDNIVSSHAKLGKRTLSFVWSDSTSLPKELSGVTVLAVVVFHNDLRPGIEETIQFFQKRGVHIRIISGDHAVTTQAIAASAGIEHSDKVITGKELALWNDEEYATRAHEYSIFAEILPEQKEKIITALKKHGFTAMVGDGANDALAIKSAHVGIAMFDGAAATRHLASVVLTNNSFSALPAGIELVDSIIKNAEIFSALFLNQTLMGIFFFSLLSLGGYEFPFTPLNITFINYFTIGLPGILIMYWTLFPVGKVAPSDETPFFQRIVPFSAISAAVQAAGAAVIFLISPQEMQMADSHTLVLFAFMVFGLAFFIFTPRVFRGVLTGAQKLQIGMLSVFVCVAVTILYHIPAVTTFFSLTSVSISLGLFGSVFLICAFVFLAQYLIAKRFYD